VSEQRCKSDGNLFQAAEPEKLNPRSPNIVIVQRSTYLAVLAFTKVKVAKSRDHSEPSWPNTVPVSLEAGGGIPCRPNTAAALLVMSYYFFKLCLKMEIL